MGADARPALGALALRRLAGAPGLREPRVRRLGRDVLVVGRVEGAR